MKKNLRYGRSVMRTIFSATLLYTATVGAAQASIVAVQGFSGGTDYPAYGSPGATLGWEFTPTSNISVTSLGFWDITPDTPLKWTHEVGLWTSVGTLLASATILTDSALVDSFRYEAIAPVNLIAGTSYLIGAFFSASTAKIDYFRSAPTSINMASEITFNNAARSASGTGLAAPTILSTPPSNGRFGPNFEFTTTASAVPSPSPAPEPFSLGLVGIGVACLAARRRRPA